RGGAARVRSGAPWLRHSTLPAGDRLSIEPEPVDLAELAETLANEFRAVARSTGHELSVEGAEGVTAVPDEERARQIGRILLENALVHTPPGTRVRVGSERRDGSAVLHCADERPRLSSAAAWALFY